MNAEAVCERGTNDDLDCYLRRNFQVWSAHQLAPPDGYMKLLKQICTILYGKLAVLPSACNGMGGIEASFIQDKNTNRCK